jgi:CCR4-NOT transcription complex subunit 6
MAFDQGTTSLSGGGTPYSSGQESLVSNAIGSWDDADPDSSASRTARREPSTAGLTPSGSLAAAEGVGQGRLYVRLDQPVEGCGLEPYATLIQSGGGAVPDPDSSILSYRWLRSTDGLACANAHCKRNERVVFGKAAAPPAAPVQCMQCVALAHEGSAGRGAPPGFAPPSPTGLPSVFCSRTCMRWGWREHSQYHTRLRAVEDADEVHFLRTLRAGAAATVPSGGGGRAAPVGLTTLLPDDGSGGAPPREGSSWEEIGTGKAIVPSASHVGRKLRLEVRATPGPGRAVSQACETPWVLPQPRPATRRRFLLAPGVGPPASATTAAARGAWAQAVAGRGVRDVSGGPTALRLMNYNVLADLYASQTQYPYVPLWQLSWAYRGRVVLRQLLAADADVLCLQEVQSDAFEAQLRSALNGAGYSALYKTKTRESMGLEGKVDGCAIFYKRSRFRLASYFVIELNEAAEAMLRAEAGRLDVQLASRAITAAEYEARRPLLDSAAKRLCKGNVAQVAVLHLTAAPDGTPLASEVPLLIVCTHLHWDPALADVKLWQMSCLLKEVEKLAAAGLAGLGLPATPSQSGSLPLLLCGDLNSEPTSGVYKLLGNNVYAPPNASGAATAAAGRVPSSLVRVDLRSADLPRDPCGILPTRGALGHSLPLASLHRSVTGAEPLFTNFTRGFVGCLDYVWHNLDAVRPLSAQRLPTAEELTGRPLPPAVEGGVRTTGGSGGFSSGELGSGVLSPAGSGCDRGGEGGDPTLSEALPNAQYPSDHLPLVFEVEISMGGRGFTVVSYEGGGGEGAAEPAPAPAPPALVSPAGSLYRPGAGVPAGGGGDGKAGVRPGTGVAVAPPGTPPPGLSAFGRQGASAGGAASASAAASLGRGVRLGPSPGLGGGSPSGRPVGEGKGGGGMNLMASLEAAAGIYNGGMQQGQGQGQYGSGAGSMPQHGRLQAGNGGYGQQPQQWQGQQQGWDGGSAQLAFAQHQAAVAAAAALAAQAGTAVGRNGMGGPRKDGGYGGGQQGPAGPGSPLSIHWPSL